MVKLNVEQLAVLWASFDKWSSPSSKHPSKTGISFIDRINTSYRDFFNVTIQDPTYLHFFITQLYKAKLQLQAKAHHYAFAF
ncbi:MAG TPA: hypothetical protein VD794_05715 [Flavisolibacter sp.]|nr:hypothetical protein [Flavisolibacter sp.]